MKRFLTLFGLGLLILLYQNCGVGFRPAGLDEDQEFSSITDDDIPPDIDVIPAPPEPTIAEKAGAILTQKCALCHGPTSNIQGVPPNLADVNILGLSEYVVGGSPDRSTLLDHLEGIRTPMPPDPTQALTPDELADMVAWIQSIPPPAIVPASFSVDILPIIQTNCLGCHNAMNPQGAVLLDSYANVLLFVVPNDANTSRINLTLKGMGGVNANIQMPPVAPLNQTQIDLIDQWVNEGARDN